MNEHDKTVAMATGKLMAAAGPSKAIPWDLVIDAILSLLKNCNPPASEARSMLENAGPFLRLRLIGELRRAGLSGVDARNAMLAAIKAAGDSSDEEAAQFLAMASAL